MIAGWALSASISTASLASRRESGGAGEAVRVGAMPAR